MSHPDPNKDEYGLQCPKCGHEAKIVAVQSARFVWWCRSCHLHGSKERQCDTSYTRPETAWAYDGETI